MWDSTLTVVTAAPDRTLLTLVELREICGVSGHGKDTQLKRLNSAVAATLTAECKIAAASAVQATLRSETLTEELRPLYTRLRHEPAPSVLQLARRPIISVTSVVENGVTLDDTGYRIQGSKGQIIRLSAGNDGHWAYAPITATYVAGWATVPDLLKQAAERLARDWWFESQRDPSLKSKEIAGIGSFAYRWSSTSDAALPQDVLDLLAEYRNPLA